MSFKSLVQIVIVCIIFVILGSVYFKYFSNNDQILVEENTDQIVEKENTDQIVEKENTDQIVEEENTDQVVEKENTDQIIEEKDTKKIAKLNDGQKLKKIKNNINDDKKKEVSKVETKKKTKKKTNIENLVTEIEYITKDDKGNKYNILASSGKTNPDDNDILDLVDVRGTITSTIRPTIYIVSDFAEYNSRNLNSNFYQNVVITYEDKIITCENFDINMETNLAIAYNNVIVTDPKSVMKAGKIILDTKTKDINILPSSELEKVKVETQ